MRNISAVSLAAIQQTSGLEPVIVVRIWWTSTTSIDYADRKFPETNLVGKLLEIGSIEDVVDINAAASSVSLSVTLDDTDGTIKDIYNYNDIHKKRVQVFQWFSNIPFTEAFVIFEGEISSPIVWSEGARNLKFEVVTKLEDLEVGFSAEEGKFPFMPSSLIGKAWPVVFGRVAGLKLINLTEPPSAILASGFGIVNDEIWDAELADLDAAIATAHAKKMEAYQLHLNNALIAGAYGTFGPLPDDPSQVEQYQAAAVNYYNQSIDYGMEELRLVNEKAAKEEQRENQEATEFRVLPITQSNLPTGYQLTVEIGNYTCTAIIIGQSISLMNLTEKVNINDHLGTNKYALTTTTDEYKREHTGQKYIWIEGGTEIRVFNFPRHYIAGIGHLNVLNVWATNKYGRAVVPRGWYVVQHVIYGPLTATKIVFPTPLTSFPGEWQDGDIEIDCVSSLPTNAVGIMEWAIAGYSSFSRDVSSFNHVRSRVAAYPCNFALTERKDVVRFLQEIAFQSRCAIWLNDRKFYLRYLPERLAAVETITDSDLEVDSVSVTSTPTERLVTKFVATWRERHNQDEPNKIIFRYNIRKYGVLEEEYDFYIYNQERLVKKSAEFWMIRKSNTFKYISCKALLHKLRIETFDPVEFSFSENLVAIVPVIGIIEKSQFNPDDDTITIEAWLPVRLGEMVVFDFAQPMNIQLIYPPRSDDNIHTGNPYEDATGEIIPIEIIPPQQVVASTVLDIPYTHGTGTPIGDANDTAPGSIITQLDPSEINGNRPVGINDFNNQSKWQIKPVIPFAITKTAPITAYGEVIEKIEDNLYTVDVFFNGLDESPELIQVRIATIRAGSELKAGYPLQVHRMVWVNNLGVSNFEYWAQPPIWFPPVV